MSSKYWNIFFYFPKNKNLKIRTKHMCVGSCLCDVYVTKTNDWCKNITKVWSAFYIKFVNKTLTNTEVCTYIPRMCMCVYKDLLMCYVLKLLFVFLYLYPS